MWCNLTRLVGQRHLLLKCGLPGLQSHGFSLSRPGSVLFNGTLWRLERMLLTTLTSLGSEQQPQTFNEYASEGLRFLRNEEDRKRRALERVAEVLSATTSAERWQHQPSTQTGAPLVQELPWPLAQLFSLLQVRGTEADTGCDPFRLVETHLNQLAERVLGAVAADHPVLRQAARYFFELPGKRFRPAVVLLMAQATYLQSLGTVNPAQLQLAMITEMIHTASLLHDDVIDESNMRRSTGTVNALFGNQLAVLAGDFLLARASVCLAQLRDCDVVELLSRVIEHLVQGEVLQLNHTENERVATQGLGLEKALWPSFPEYMRKTWYKTASLIANSCRAVTLLNPISRCQPHIVQAATRYGDHLGLAFQLVDDAMDYHIPCSSMGKPAYKDLAQGTVTAPVLLALEGPAKVDVTKLSEAWRTRDSDCIARLVREGLGVEKTLALAAEHVRDAKHALTAPVSIESSLRNESALPSSPARDALIALCDRVLNRQR